MVLEVSYEDSKAMLEDALNSMDAVQLKALVDGMGTAIVTVPRERLSMLQPAEHYMYAAEARVHCTVMEPTHNYGMLLRNVLGVQAESSPRPTSRTSW